jgi:hypothetical protein
LLAHCLVGQLNLASVVEAEELHAVVGVFLEGFSYRFIGHDTNTVHELCGKTVRKPPIKAARYELPSFEVFGLRVENDTEILVLE